MYLREVELVNPVLLPCQVLWCVWPDRHSKILSV